MVHLHLQQFQIRNHYLSRRGRSGKSHQRWRSPKGHFQYRLVEGKLLAPLLE
jgi:hypothetical protein